MAEVNAVALRDQYMKTIMELPQSRFVPRDVAENWLNMTLLADPDRVPWHIRRAGGFGGSEAGVLLDHASDAGFFEGELANPFVTPERLVKQKLLRIPPDVPGTDAKRGLVLEPVMRSMFEDILTREGYRWSRRDDLNSIIDDGPHPHYPWMLSNIDGLYEIAGTANGKDRLMIVDFKAPTEESLKRHKENTPLSYVAQMNHYALAASGKDIAVSELSLVMFDYKNFGDNPLLVKPVEISQDIQNAIIQGGASLWHDHVLAGRVPLRENKGSSISGSIPEEIKSAAFEMRDAKEQIKFFTNKKSELSEQILCFMLQNGLSSLVVPCDNGKRLSFSLRRDLPDSALERILPYSEDPSELWNLDFRNRDDAARWLTRLLEELGSIRERLPEGVRSLLESAPEMVQGSPKRDVVLKRLESLGEKPDDFFHPTLVSR